MDIISNRNIIYSINLFICQYYCVTFSQLDIMTQSKGKGRVRTLLMIAGVFPINGWI